MPGRRSWLMRFNATALSLLFILWVSMTWFVRLFLSFFYLFSSSFYVLPHPFMFSHFIFVYFVWHAMLFLFFTLFRLLLWSLFQNLYTCTRCRSWSHYWQRTKLELPGRRSWLMRCNATALSLLFILIVSMTWFVRLFLSFSICFHLLFMFFFTLQE